MNGYPINVSGIRMNEVAKIAVDENTINDNAIIKLILGGKKKSYKTIVDRYQRSAFFFARGMIGNSDDAYDLSQEAFVRAYNNLNEFDPIYPFKVWFYKILSNLCKNYLRQRKSRESVVTSTEMTDIASAPKSARPDVVYEKSETQQIVWEAIGELPEKFKEIIILNHFQDMSYEQIASILDMPRGSVMSRLYYARQNLRGILEGKGVRI